MNEDNAKALCEMNGSLLQSYSRGSAAFLVFPSGKPIIVSVGVTTVKVGIHNAAICRLALPQSHSVTITCSVGAKVSEL